jgi:DNA-binding MurR/RpiR family transcriptional regulator
MCHAAHVEREPVTEMVRRALGEFPQAERKVARTLLSGALTVGLESSSKVALHAGVSGPTVIRFVNRLGFPTYAAFQSAVREELEFRFAPPIDLYPVSRPEEPHPAAPQEEMFSSSISETFSRLATADLDEAVEILGNRGLRLLVFGGWFSHFLARHFVGLLQEVRPNVHFIENSAQARVPVLADLDSRCVVVLFDYRRYESDTEKIGRLASASGAKVILFTDQWISPVADVADVVLPASVGEARPFESYVAPLALVETLVARLVEWNLDRGRERFEAFNRLARGFSTRGAPSNSERSL